MILPKIRPASAAVRPWYMCRSEPQIANIGGQGDVLFPTASVDSYQR